MALETSLELPTCPPASSQACEVTKYESLLCQVLLKPKSPKFAARLLAFTAECTCVAGKPWVTVVQTHLADLVQDALYLVI